MKLKKQAYNIFISNLKDGIDMDLQQWADNHSVTVEFLQDIINKFNQPKENKPAPVVTFEAGNIERETEKAALIKCFCVDTDQKITFWTPKSMIKDNTIPAWFADKKIVESTNAVRSLNNVTFM